MKHAASIGLALGLLLAPAVQGNGLPATNGGMPNRLSLNVTVPKQTQGATFGEKVNAGLQATGNSVAQGASMSIVIECGQAACLVTLPDGSGYHADLNRRRVEVLKSNKLGEPNARAVGSAGRGSLLGAALPGGSILSAAVSSVSAVAGGGSGAAAASYAATGRLGAAVAIDSQRRANGDIDLLQPLADGEYMLRVVLEGAGGLKDALKPTVRTTPSQKLEILLGFSVDAGVLKTKHDIAKNAIGNIR